MEIYIAIIGLIIALLTFYFSYFRKPTEELNHLEVMFRSTQKLSKSVQNEIKEFADKNNCWENEIFKNITFQKYYNVMKDSYEENLSDEVFNKATELKLTKTTIKSMTESLNKQFSELQKLESNIKLL